MKKIHHLLICCALSAFFAAPVSAQMFYNAGTGFDSTGASSYGGNSLRPSAEESDTGNKEEEPYEKIVAREIRERIRADAAYIVGEPEEALCYGIARKSPKKRSATIDGYAHTGNCGSLNETGMKEVQNKLFSAASYDMNVTKIVSCVTTPVWRCVSEKDLTLWTLFYPAETARPFCFYTAAIQKNFPPNRSKNGWIRL